MELVRNWCGGILGLLGDVFHGDLLLASTSMLIKPFAKYPYGPCGLFSELEKFCQRFKTFALGAKPTDAGASRPHEPR